MSKIPIQPKGFNKNQNIAYCCLTVNSITVYTYCNPHINDHVNVNFSEVISKNLGSINSFQGDRMDVIKLANDYKIDNLMKLSLFYSKKTFNGDTITVLILGSDVILQSFVLSLLEKIMKEYIMQYANIETFEFSMRMKEIITEEESKFKAVIDSYGSIDDDIINVQILMNENIERILERGENLESLIHKTSDLNLDAGRFRRQTKNVKRKLWWSNVKFCVIIWGMVIIFIYLLLGIDCGLPFYEKCIHPHKPRQPDQ
ncbi:Nyv1 protein [Martiniozyma asiatica (nom. inval.)]|nr:Nyv1 protein [Martiniozyma asiatica]